LLRLHNVIWGKKGKAMPVTGHGGPQSCETRLSYFLGGCLKDGSEIVGLWSQPPFTLMTISSTHFCQRSSWPQGHSGAGKIRWTEKCKSLVGTRTCDLPPSSIVLQPTMLLSASVIWDLDITMNNKQVRKWKEEIFMSIVAFAPRDRGHKKPQSRHIKSEHTPNTQHHYAKQLAHNHNWMHVFPSTSQLLHSLPVFTAHLYLADMPKLY
jgi:hypothetical protein